MPRRKVRGAITLFVLYLVIAGTSGRFSRSLVFEWDATTHTFTSVTEKAIRSGISHTNKSLSEIADINADGKPEELAVRDGKMRIIQEDQIVWESPLDWRIDNIVVTDINNDGITDINLSVWKPGDFGRSKPFWVTENDMSIKNHFFVFDFVQGTMRPLWQSSNLDAPNCEFKIADVDGDGKNDLIVIEGEYSKKPHCTGRFVAVWKWNGWGFSNEWRSDKGTLSNLDIEHIDHRVRIRVTTE